MVSQLRQKAVLRTAYSIMGPDNTGTVLSSTTRSLAATFELGLQACERIPGLSKPVVENQPQ